MLDPRNVPKLVHIMDGSIMLEDGRELIIKNIVRYWETDNNAKDME